MAKPTFSKLKLSVNTEEKEFTWEDQTIKVKQYLSVDDKLQLVSQVLNSAADENRFYNKGKIDLFFKLNIIYFYTNINFTDKQKEEFIKTYDIINSSGFWSCVKNAIPEKELDYVYDLVIDAVEQIYTYQNSIYGILDAISTDYEGLNLDIQELSKKLGDKEGIKFLDQVLTKMG